MSIEEMYKKRMKATLKGLLFLFVIPSPGLAIESFSQARSYDVQIKKMVLQQIYPDGVVNVSDVIGIQVLPEHKKMLFGCGIASMK